MQWKQKRVYIYVYIYTQRCTHIPTYKHTCRTRRKLTQKLKYCQRKVGSWYVDQIGFITESLCFWARRPSAGSNRLLAARLRDEILVQRALLHQWRCFLLDLSLRRGMTLCALSSLAWRFHAFQWWGLCVNRERLLDQLRITASALSGVCQRLLGFLTLTVYSWKLIVS